VTSVFGDWRNHEKRGAEFGKSHEVLPLFGSPAMSAIGMLLVQGDFSHFFLAPPVTLRDRFNF